MVMNMVEKNKEVERQVKKVTKQVVRQLKGTLQTTSERVLVAAIILVLTLTWRDIITQAINYLIPQMDGLIGSTISAIFMTILGALLIMLIQRGK